MYFVKSALVIGLFAASTCQAVTVTNGGFETGDFSGWTQFGNLAFASVSSDAPVPQSGTYGASFGSTPTGGGISQAVDTVAGGNYKVDFWLQNEADPFGVAQPNSFQFAWGGATTMSLVDSSAFNYTHYSFNLSATSASTVMRFTFTQAPAFWDLDNVSVTTVPEPETWALMGLGLVGLWARRRTTLAA